MNTEHYTRSEEYAKLAQEVISVHEDLLWIKNNVRIDFLESTEAKMIKDKTVFGECKLVKEIYQVYVPYDFLIIIYMPNVSLFTDEQKRILLYHELLHVDFKEDKNGSIDFCVRPHDIEDFKTIINNYGLDWQE